MRLNSYKCPFGNKEEYPGKRLVLFMMQITILLQTFLKVNIIKVDILKDFHSEGLQF